MLPLDQALNQMLSQLPFPTQHETLSLTEAINRVCAEDVVSPINVPSFDNSAMDGYAVRLADLAQSLTLSVAGKSFAGNPFKGEWIAQSAVRIMTGAMISEGADAVVMQEQVAVNEDGTITLNEYPKAGQNIRRIGEDIKKGDIVLQQGDVLNAVSLPLLASLGIAEVKVYPRLKVAVLSTGDELVQVGQPLKEGQIYDTNRFTIKLMLQQLNCEVLDLGLLPDNEVEFEKAFIEAQRHADLLITSGGVSVGEADFTKAVLEKVGTVNFWKIAMKPGKPFAFGKLYNAWFCGLPGNPVSALVTFYQLVQPAILQLSGQKYPKKQPHFTAIATTDLKKTPGRLDFQRGYYQMNENGQIEVQSVGFQGSHLFSSFVKSNCFIVLEKDRGNVTAGETVTIEPFNYLLGQ
ncbi:molybdopterin molybdotransferase MoeA [Rodentibacter sp. Ppn85]|uniref:molybdopterin molybdotransferase MoeA n=1 Tax=Rodentibacter sp. Ppn85 TaxID=1908525 RepID=UPI000987A97A|nr:molybdopterin molybdotransferase MoeA [Rodentibacter sp. Ppn85]OOF66251.1 molybdopterin molybdenumtransferase MoeA [Rodentibacter sp. Ppn85]